VRGPEIAGVMSEGFEVEARIEPPEGAPRSWLIPAIAATTAALAVAAALSSLLAGEAAHHSLAALNEAAIFQSQASDQWNFYQAEGIKRHTFEVQRDVARLQADPPHLGLAARQDAEARRYASQQAQIRRDAEALEHRRDAAEALSQRYDVRYEHLGRAVAFFQIGIVVCSVAAIVRLPALWYLGLAGGLAGAVSLLQAISLPLGGGPGG